MNTRCIVVIGHVDHGKTSLVRALTGIETDRLAEEKERGLSIALGFAHRAYPEGIIDFIDAPGHEDFIQAMVSGATGAQSILAVISLTEGIGAQTLEHLTIAGLLGLTNGVIAVTKSDTLEPSSHAARLDVIRSELAQTPFADAELLLCSALTGDGLDALHLALQKTLSGPANASTPLQSILPIDRVFSMPGHGTIVTGTLLGQELHVNTDAVLQPDGRKTTVRGLQSRGEKSNLVKAGERVAVNLRSVAVKDIPRGAALCVGDALPPSTCFDVSIGLNPWSNTALKHNEDIRVMFGTSSEIASVRVFGGKQIAPKQSGHAQLRFKKRVVGFAGQKAILRRLSPPETLGGATILDPIAMPTKSTNKRRLAVLQAAETQDIQAIGNALCEAHGGVASLSDVARLSRVTTQAAEQTLSDAFETLGPDMISAKHSIAACEAEVLRALELYHEAHPLHAMAPRTSIVPRSSSALANHVITSLTERGRLRQQDAHLAHCDHDPMSNLSKDQRARMAHIETSFRESSLSPPMLENVAESQLDRDLVALLIDAGNLIELRNISLNQTLVFHSDALTSAAAELRAAFPLSQSFTTSEARTALATSRRIIVPVLEYFDGNGVTARTGDARQVVQANSVSTSDPV
ncbi:selenocysteine-specific translation elongation factor [Sulfitobacter sp.]|uniref:selenocysteine-specific translation elongation factor n=1 Tax=Sulfitobacter sp. TaxID=1903071 RepID=UPI003EF70D10